MRGRSAPKSSRGRRQNWAKVVLGGHRNASGAPAPGEPAADKELSHAQSRRRGLAVPRSGLPGGGGDPSEAGGEGNGKSGPE